MAYNDTSPSIFTVPEQKVPKLDVRLFESAGTLPDRFSYCQTQIEQYAGFLLTNATEALEASDSTESRLRAAIISGQLTIGVSLFGTSEPDESTSLRLVDSAQLTPEVADWHGQLRVDGDSLTLLSQHYRGDRAIALFAYNHSAMCYDLRQLAYTKKFSSIIRAESGQCDVEDLIPVDDINDQNALLIVTPATLMGKAYRRMLDLIADPMAANVKVAVTFD
jgi:hypothetical protein